MENERRFAKLMRRLPLSRINFHSLRHGHASLALAQGVRPKIVSERLGHVSAVFTGWRDKPPLSPRCNSPWRMVETRRQMGRITTVALNARIVCRNGTPKRFRQLVELGLEFRTGFQDVRELRSLRPQSIGWLQ
jgi:hypothetical protein